MLLVNSKKSSKRGFTLVELSIVLIVVGLLASGIVAASRLITNARSNSVLSVYRETNNANKLFQSLYGGVPGDTTIQSIKHANTRTRVNLGAAAQGNNDTRIAFGCAGSSDCTIVEALNFYPYLEQSGVYSATGLPSSLVAPAASKCTGDALNSNAMTLNVKADDASSLKAYPVYSAGSQYLVISDVQETAAESVLTAGDANSGTQGGKACNLSALSAVGVPSEIAETVDEKIDSTADASNGRSRYVASVGAEATQAFTFETNNFTSQGFLAISL